MRNNSIATRARGGRPVRLVLSSKDREGVFELACRAGPSGGSVRRAQVVLLSQQGLSGREIGQRLGLSVGQVSRIRSRFRRYGLAGLADRPRTGRGNRVAPSVELALFAARRVGGVAPTIAELAARFELSRSTVYKIIRRMSQGAGPSGGR